EAGVNGHLARGFARRGRRLGGLDGVGVAADVVVLLEEGEVVAGAVQEAGDADAGDAGADDGDAGQGGGGGGGGVEGRKGGGTEGRRDGRAEGRNLSLSSFSLSFVRGRRDGMKEKDKDEGRKSRARREV